MSKTSINARLAMIQAFSEFMNNGSQNATVIFYDGTQPAGPEVAADSAKALVTLVLPKPCIKEVAPNYIELHPSNAGVVTKAGDAIWARIYNGAGEVAADLTFGIDITLINTSLALGGTLVIQSIKLKP